MKKKNVRLLLGEGEWCLVIIAGNKDGEIDVAWDGPSVKSPIKPWKSVRQRCHMRPQFVIGVTQPSSVSPSWWWTSALLSPSGWKLDSFVSAEIAIAGGFHKGWDRPSEFCRGSLKGLLQSRRQIAYSATREERGISIGIHEIRYLVIIISDVCI